MIKISTLIFPLAMMGLSTFLNATTYENAEDKSIDRWKIYDNKPAGAVITNIFDKNKKSRVINFLGEGRRNAYFIGAKRGDLAWNNTTEKIIKWSMNFSEKFKISLYIKTTEGDRVIYYTHSNSDEGLTKNKYVRIGLGDNSKKGSWVKIERNIEKDIQKYEPNNRLLAVNGFKVQGSGKIDNLKLISKKNTKPIVKTKVYFTGKSKTTKGWSILDNNPAGASMKNLYDKKKKSRVIQLQGNGRNNAYRIGAKHGSKIWNDTTHNTISWSMNIHESYKIVVYVETTKGLRHFYFTHNETSKGLYNKNYIHIGLGEKSKNGRWQTFSFNLADKLKKYENDNQLLKINGFKVMGSGRFDDIKLQSKKRGNSKPNFNKKEALGEALYLDKSLSKNRTMSCSTCHSRTSAFIDERQSPIGHMAAQSADRQFIADRNVPTNAYAALIPPFHFDKKEKQYVGGNFLDGSAKDLHEQAKGPFLNPIEMQMPSAAAVVERVRENDNYISSLQELYGKNIFDNSDDAYDAITDAIAKFEETKTFKPFDSKYDRMLKGTYTFTPQEQKGLELFSSESKGNCIDCHTLGNFTDYTYDNLGVPVNHALRTANGSEANYIDHGLLGNPAVNDVRWDGAFRVSTLRNIAKTAPYMHNGIFKDLKTVVHFYNTRDVEGAINPETGNVWEKPEVPATMNHEELGNLGLSDAEEDAIVSFMETLTDKRYEK